MLHAIKTGKIQAGEAKFMFIKKAVARSIRYGS